MVQQRRTEDDRRGRFVAIEVTLLLLLLALFVLVRAPEVLSAQVRGRFIGRRRSRRFVDRLHRERRAVVDGNLVATVSGIEVTAPAGGRRVRTAARRVLVGRCFTDGRGRFVVVVVRRLGRRRVLARFTAAAVHARQRVVSGRTAGRVRLLRRCRRRRLPRHTRSRLVAVAAVVRTTGTATAGQRRRGRSRRHDDRSRFSRQRRAPRRSRGRQTFRLAETLVLVVLRKNNNACLFITHTHTHISLVFKNKKIFFFRFFSYHLH